jgi:phosphoribosylanthranilate isomerase
MCEGVDVVAEVKFCGITRADDAAEAARLGASYVGAIFAGGPRLIEPPRAAANFRGLPEAVRRVGVFGTQDPDEVASIAAAATVDVIQLHGDPDVAMLDAVRKRAGLEIWPVIRIEGTVLPPAAESLAGVADALVLDARVEGVPGGSGRQLDWAALAQAIGKVRSRTGCRIVLAGGLTPENVRRAIELVRPNVVDVSSGVERAPGIKDHARMRAFRDAVEQAGVEQ